MLLERFLARKSFGHVAILHGANVKTTTVLAEDTIDLVTRRQQRKRSGERWEWLTGWGFYTNPNLLYVESWNMKCPHCAVTVHLNWWTEGLHLSSQGVASHVTKTARCPNCTKDIVQIGDRDLHNNFSNFQIVIPLDVSREPVPSEVPPDIAEDYSQACRTLRISSKASAALSRRCLQNMLHGRGYHSRDLAKQIQAILDEPDTSKAIPENLRITIDGIRNFGNFSAHPLTDLTTLQIVDVEPEEAEWCLEIIEDCFDHFYVKPVAAKARKAALDAKLLAAGKPASK